MRPDIDALEHPGYALDVPGIIPVFFDTELRIPTATSSPRMAVASSATSWVMRTRATHASGLIS